LQCLRIASCKNQILTGHFVGSLFCTRHSGNPLLEQKVIANFAAKDRGEGKVAEEKLLTLKRDSSRNRYPQQLCRKPERFADRAFSFMPALGNIFFRTEAFHIICPEENPAKEKLARKKKLEKKSKQST
jgi:hypothetical protein